SGPVLPDTIKVMQFVCAGKTVAGHIDFWRDCSTFFLDCSTLSPWLTSGLFTNPTHKHHRPEGLLNDLICLVCTSLNNLYACIVCGLRVFSANTRPFESRPGEMPEHHLKTAQKWSERLFNDCENGSKWV
ncbi:hypothetical protein, partial [Corynebacterium coyleae]|uniref:hypothetical protein n=1 Tax=Corynebacterium coyleae TaxID=53374 RepID=UPI001ADC80E5